MTKNQAILKNRVGGAFDRKIVKRVNQQNEAKQKKKINADSPNQEEGYNGFFKNTCINPSYPESKEKSLPFRRLKLTVIHVSKNFR